MILKNLTLQNFRNYTKSEFEFDNKTTVIVGPNAIGKTNLIEAAYLLSSGKSFKTDKDRQIIKLGQSVCRVKGTLAGPVELLPRPTSSRSLRALAGVSLRSPPAN